MTSFERVVRDIKSLKIQGAQHVAIASLDALKDVVKRSPAKTNAFFVSHVKKAHHILLKTRPTEPGMRNALMYALAPLENDSGLSVLDMKKSIVSQIRDAKTHLVDSQKTIAKIGMKKIKKNMVVYTHCHSTTVTAILHSAKMAHIPFVVHNTETRPRYQGRKTATELAKSGIHVEHYVDSGMVYALKKADIVLLGVDAITSEGFVANKIGTATAVEIARRYDIPVYFCTDSWKFDPLTVGGGHEEIEMRNPCEVWERPPKNVHINNFAFDLVHPDGVSGVISELGVLSMDAFLDAVIRRNPWMCK